MTGQPSARMYLSCPYWRSMEWWRRKWPWRRDCGRMRCWSLLLPWSASDCQCVSPRSLVRRRKTYILVGLDDDRQRSATDTAESESVDTGTDYWHRPVCALGLVSADMSLTKCLTHVIEANSEHQQAGAHSCCWQRRRIMSHLWFRDHLIPP
jgi:hypothetical protein